MLTELKQGFLRSIDLTPEGNDPFMDGICIGTFIIFLIWSIVILIQEHEKSMKRNKK